MDYKIDFCEKHTDFRGYLVEFLKFSEMPKDKNYFGQIYFVTFEKPNVVRGNHYHKKFSEWFGLVYGKIEMVIEDINTKERIDLILDSNDKKFVRIYTGPFVAHAFRSISETAVLLNYVTEEYNKNDPDRYEYVLIKM